VGPIKPATPTTPPNNGSIGYVQATVHVRWILQRG
jgi:hypothetical protein